MAGKRAYGSGSKRELSPGVWQLRYAGRSRTVRGTSKEAEAALVRFVASGPTRVMRATKTVDALLDDWMASTQLEASTRYTVIGARKHLPAAFLKRRIDQLRPVDFENLYRELEAKRVSVHQIHKLHGTLSSAFSQALRLGLIDAHPVKGARPPRIPDRKVKPPSKAQIDLLLVEAAKDLQTHTWLRLAVMTGMRRGELVALRWSDVDLVAATVRVDESLRLDKSVKATKTNRVRIIQIDALTVALLAEWRVGQRLRAAAAGIDVVADAWVLSNTVDSGEPWRPDYATYVFRRLCIAAGVAEVRLHDLRHAMASQLLEAGVSPVTVAARLGHANTNTTLRVYAHLVAGADKAAANLMSSIIDGDVRPDM